MSVWAFTRPLLALVISVFNPAAAFAQVDTLTGFYAVDDAACLQPKGTLLLCSGDSCIAQDYEDSVPLQPQPWTMRGTVATRAEVDSNGFGLQPGDVSFRFDRGGSSNLQIIRRTPQGIQTTHLARIRNGRVGFTFIENGMSKDPSASAAPLQLCRAYSANVAQWDFPPLYLLPAAEAPKGEGWERFDRSISKIELRYEEPKNHAWITQIVPIILDDPDYPALFVFWVFGLGGTPLPLQILTYDHAEYAYLDTTSSYFRAEIPTIDWASGVTVGPIGIDGRMGILISAIGMDAPPFPRTMNTLLFRNKEGLFVDRSDILPRELHFSHFISDGTINEAGDLGIYINNMFVPEYYIGSGNGRLTNARKWLPEVLRKDGPKFAVSVMADVNGDGAADLVLGSQDSMIDPAVVYRNDGTGRFDRTDPILLPEPAMPDLTLPITGKVIGSVYTDLKAIRLDPDQDYDDLVAVTSVFYRGYSVQVLRNDGTGQFTDVTRAMFDAPEVSYYREDEKQFTYVSRARVFSHNGQTYVLVKSQSEGVDSYVYRLVEDKFFVSDPISRGAVENAASFNGVPLLIRVDKGEIALTAFPEL